MKPNDRQKEIDAHLELVRCGHLPKSHEEPMPHLLEDGWYSKTLDSVGADESDSTPTPTPAPKARNPEFWSDMHQIAEQFQREEQPLHQRQASLRSIAYNAGVSLDNRQIRWLDKEAERAIHDWKDGYDATEAIRVPLTKWLWDGIFLLGVVNLLIAREKVGKTSLIVYLLRCWLSSSGAMGIEMAQPPEHPAIFIAGTDQGLADWSWYLAKSGLATEKVIDDDNAEFRLVPEVIKLWTQDAPIFFDEEGIANLTKWVSKHPGALLICDSLSSLTGPLGLKENDADFAEPLRALSRAMEKHRVTTIVIHHAAKGSEDQRGSTSSRGTTAIAAAVSRIVQLAWVAEKDKTDSRIALTTEGRQAKPVGLVIEQVEACSWVKVGDLDDIAREEGRKKAEENLTERQEFALAEVRDVWEQDHHEMEATLLVERLPAEYTGKDKARKARENLDQLYRKSLVDKRRIGADGAKRNLYRPFGAELSQVKLRLPVCLKDPPQSPESPNPSNDGLVGRNSTLFSPHQSSAEGAECSEGVTDTQGELLGKTPPITKKRRPHRLVSDDPHWGPRPTTNGKEVG